MRKGLGWFCVVLAGLLALGTAAGFGQGKGRNLNMRGMGLAPLVNNAKVQQALNLSADQIERLRQLQQSSAAGFVDQRAQLKSHRMELQGLLSAQNVDRAAVDRKIDEIAAVRTAMAKERMNAQLTVRSILTPEQLAKVKEKRQALKGRMMERRKMKHKGGNGGDGEGSVGL